MKAWLAGGASAALLFAPGTSHACDFEHAAYSYTGAPDVVARFAERDDLRPTWQSNHYLVLEVGGETLYLLYDRGAARRIAFVSTSDPRLGVPGSDGGPRPYGGMTFFGWDAARRAYGSVPDVPPAYFVIPELSESLWQGPAHIDLAPGVFELRCSR